MAFKVEWIVRRHMKATEKFTEADSLAEFPLPHDVHLAPGEALIGWYSNPPPWEKHFVVFSDRAIYSVESGHCSRLDMSDIVDYEFPKSKAEADGVRVRTKDGFRFVRVAGVTGPGGKHKDAFSFIMIVGKLAGRNARDATPK